MTPDITAALWVLGALLTVVIGMVVFVVKKGLLENETHLDKMKQEGG